MNKILLSTVALAAISGSAIAADLPSHKAPVVAPPAPMWTGFYAGLNAGYNFGTNSNVYSQNWSSPWTSPVQPISITGAAPIALDLNKPNTQSGFIGGAQFGYNYQYGSNIVMGLETDIQGASIRGSSNGTGAAVVGQNILQIPLNSVASGATAVQAGLDYLGTVRGRLGYLWSPTLLLYGTGGFAYGGAWANVVQQAIGQVQVQGQAVQSSTFGGGQQSQLLTGWAAGGGLEWMFMPSWSLKGEALYWDLGRMNINTTNFGVSPIPGQINDKIGWGRSNVNYSGVQAKIGVNYHFNFANVVPVVAKF